LFSGYPTGSAYCALGVWTDSKKRGKHKL